MFFLHFFSFLLKGSYLIIYFGLYVEICLALGVCLFGICLVGFVDFVGDWMWWAILVSYWDSVEIV